MPVRSANRRRVSSLRSAHSRAGAKVILAGITLAMLTGGQTAIAGTDKADRAANEEILTVTSSNPLNFYQLMQDPKVGGEGRVDARLTFPPDAPADARLPAVIFVHGSGGPLARHGLWLELMRDMGIATVYANHFAPRRQISTVGDQTNVSGAAMTADALHLLKAAAAHPRIDPARIGIMGSSKGGGVAIYTAWNPVRKKIAEDRRFAVHIPLYPTCVYWEDKDLSNRPIMVLLGEKDNWTGVRHCVESVKELQAAGHSEIRVKIYPGAHHGFDGGKGIGTIGRGYSVVDCRFVIRADGREFASGVHMDSVANKRKALGGCATRGVSIGGGEALPQAMKDVRDFLTKSLLQ